MIRLGAKNDTVRAVQHLLTELGYRALGEARPSDKVRLHAEALDIDSIFGPQTQSALMDFQRAAGVLADGVLGPRTMAALEAAYTRHHLEVNAPGTDALAAFDPSGNLISDGGAARRLPFVRVELDRPIDAQSKEFVEGFAAIQLRADAAQALKAANQELRGHGGWLTMSDGKRALDAPVTPARSATSLHYLGRAFDLCTYAGMVDPDHDLYVVQLPEDGREALARHDHLRHTTETLDARSYEQEPWCWTVWARCVGPDSSDVSETKISNVATYLDRRSEQGTTVTGRFVNLTALLREHKFTPIAPRPNFFDFRGEFINAEWWHFQYESGLFPEVSTYGGELLRVYSEATLAGTPPWEHRHKVFRREWG